MHQGTAIQIIQQASAELGLPVPTSGVTSREITTIQLIALLNSAGYELSFAHEWQVLNRTATITTVAGQTTYDLPADFGRMINQTIWTSDSLQPVTGPISPQSWESNTKGISGLAPFLGFRISGNQLVIDPAPGESGQTITFEYISNGWIHSYLDPAVYLTTIGNDNDTILFDMVLMVKLLKVKMWNAKGLDSTAIEGEFRQMYNMLISADKGAPKLSVGGRRYSRSIADCVPQTGYGQ